MTGRRSSTNKPESAHYTQPKSELLINMDDSTANDTNNFQNSNNRTMESQNSLLTTEEEEDIPIISTNHHQTEKKRSTKSPIARIFSHVVLHQSDNSNH